MIDIKTFTSLTHASEAKRLLRYILLWCKNGRTDIIIDEHRFSLSENQVITITSGQYYQIKEISGDLVVLNFSWIFLQKTTTILNSFFITVYSAILE